MTDSNKEKVFKDSVHGYIHVPNEWCRLFIDTPIFQRLRHIEQTSMRCLYPSARHDRFIHSLGVYHLGKQAFYSLYRNAKSLIDEVGFTSPEDIDRLKNSFLVACLLHDCAHAPFSHTFEHYYDEGNALSASLCHELANDPEFADDFEDASPKPHEKASALVLMQQFKDAVTKVDADPLLAARMIIGCVYRATNDKKKRFTNVLIQLLNSHSIDVDKLDYIVRDTWASGVSNTAVDVDRLLTAVTASPYADGAIMGLAFRKTALSVLQGVVDARNFLFTWIYGHHKVQYDKYLLCQAVSELGNALHDQDALRKIFSLEALTKTVDVGGEKIHAPSDGDIIFLLKRYREQIPAAAKWLSRDHGHKTLWKTYIEYEEWFHALDGKERQAIRKRLSNPEELQTWWLHQGGSQDHLPVVLLGDIKPYQISRNDIRIVLHEGKEPVSYDTLFDKISGPGHKVDPNFFYFYQPLVDEQETIDPNKLKRAICELA